MNRVMMLRGALWIFALPSYLQYPKSEQTI
jgi:hypothetical protein